MHHLLIAWQCRRSRCCNANFLGYSKNYRKAIERLRNYYRVETNNLQLVGTPPSVYYNADPITNSESFKFKSSITGKWNYQMNIKKTVITLSKNLKIAAPLFQDI